MKIQKRHLAVLQRVADLANRGRPMLKRQLVNPKYFIDRGYLRLDWGPENTPDRDKMVWYLTERGKEVLDGQS